MRLTTISPWLVLIGLAVPPACSVEEDNTPANASAFCEAWGNAACSALAVEQCSSPDRDTCATYQQADCLKRLDADLYSKAGANECLDAVRRAYDDAKLSAEELATVFGLEGDCARVQSTESPEGTQCESDAECDVAAGFACVVRTDTGAPEGECHVPVTATGGNSCKDKDVVCTPGFYCNGSHCLARPAKGDDCSFAEPCLEELRCVGAGGSGACADKLGLRAACTADDECASGLCSESSDGARGCATSVLLDFNKAICDAFGPPVANGDESPAADAGPATGDAGQ